MTLWPVDVKCHLEGKKHNELACTLVSQPTIETSFHKDLLTLEDQVHVTTEIILGSLKKESNIIS